MSLKIMSVLMDAVESVSVSNKSSADILKMAEPESSRKSSCELNDAFGLILQGVLAFTAFCILILKRLREPIRERRPVQIWFYDTSKQAIGAVIIHFANVLLAGAFKGDPCTWYFINFLLDTTLGLIIIWLSLKFTQFVVRRNGWTLLRFGEYGTPPRFAWWLAQCLVYIAVMLFEKSIIVLLVQLHFWETVRQFILRPVKNHPKIEVFIVMLMVPFLMNALMFWVVDNFLMRKHRKPKPNGNNPRVEYLLRPSEEKSSDDEVVLHSLIQNEAQDTVLDDGDVVHRALR